MKRRKIYARGGLTPINGRLSFFDAAPDAPMGAYVPTYAPLSGSAPASIRGWKPAPPASRTPLDWSKLDSVMPYVSNIANSFRRLPLPPAPRYTDTITPQRVDYSNQRVAINRRMRGANLGADRSLDENTATAVKAYNRAHQINALNDVNAQESNTNAQLRAEADRINAGIRAHNDALANQYEDRLIEADAARQRLSSENLANAVDKYIMQKDQRRRADLDELRLKAMQPLWANSGVYDRYMEQLKRLGIKDPAGISLFPNGGSLGRKYSPEEKEMLYSSYMKQLKSQGIEDPARIANILILADEQGVSPASVYTTSNYVWDPSEPNGSGQIRNRTYTIIEKGKPVKRMRQAIGGVSVGANHLPVSEGIAMRANGGGLSRKRDYGSKKKPYPSVRSSDFAGGGRSYPIPTKADARDALRLAGLHHRPDVKAKVYRKYPDLRKKAFGGSL